MSDDESIPGDTPLERELSGRFAQLRSSEASQALPFRAPPATRVVHPVVRSTYKVAQIVPRLAAAAVIAGVGFMVLRESPVDDPAALYAGIMNKQLMQTDSLLVVSDSVLPAQHSVPILYDIDAALGTEADAK